MGTLAVIADQEEMLHNTAFHQGLHCLLRHKRSSEKMQNHLKIITCNPSIYNGPSQVFLYQTRKKSLLDYKED